MVVSTMLRGKSSRVAFRIAVVGAALVLLSACGSNNASSKHGTDKPMHTSAPAMHHPSGKIRSVVNVPAGLAASALTSDQVNQMLSAHNTLRQQYGQAPLVWSNDLASWAQDWANQIAASGNFSHRPNNPYGENIFFGTGTGWSPQDVVNDWASEVQFFDTTNNICPDYNQCGHFTQEVWGTTTTLGCGVGTATDNQGNTSQYWVCNYDPAGNITNGTDNSVKPF